MASDSSRAEFWDARYRDRATPWDAGRAPLKLASWIEGRSPARVLVPGCGSGHEVKLFAERGHDVLGIDFSDAALEAARGTLGALAARVRKADFFALDAEPFDMVYERTFLCALPRARWDDWARRAAALVRPGGLLAGFFFFDDNERGPPFGTSQKKLDALLGDAFDREEDEAIPAAQSVPVLRGRERWQAWKRRL